MFEDIIEEEEYPDQKNRLQEIHDKCPTCKHAIPSNGISKFICGISAGMTCAWSKEDPFNQYVPKD